MTRLEPPVSARHARHRRLAAAVGAAALLPAFVAAWCLWSYALTLGIKHGIWGGLSERERRRLRRARRTAA